MHRIMGLLLVGMCLSTWGLPAHATRVRKLSLTQTRDKAETVLLGTVNTITTRVNANGNMVWTDYHLAVEEILLGVPVPLEGGIATISFAGGQYGALDVGILGVPQLEARQRYVLFLLPSDYNPSATVGWGQGIFKVIEIATAGGNRPVLISNDHQPLELDTTGALFRGTPIGMDDPTQPTRSMQRAILNLAPKAPDPLSLDATSVPMTHAVSPPQTSIAAPTNRNFADISHLRRFLQGELQESLSSGR